MDDVVDYLKFRVDNYDVYLFPEGTKVGGRRKMFLKIVGEQLAVIFVIYAIVIDGKPGRPEFKENFGNRLMYIPAMAAIYAYALSALSKKSIGYLVISEAVKKSGLLRYRLVVAKQEPQKV